MLTFALGVVVGGGGVVLWLLLSFLWPSRWHKEEWIEVEKRDGKLFKVKEDKDD